MTELKIKIAWLEEMHEKWWRHLVERAPKPLMFDCTAPEIRYVDHGGSCAARANGAYCSYNVRYAASVGPAQYEETVKHEVCHTFAARVRKDPVVVKARWPLRRDGHDSLWWYLYQVVCSGSQGRFHDYDRTAAKTNATAATLRKLVALNKKLEKMSASQ